MTTVIALCWPKKWLAFGKTYIVELDGERLSLLYGGNAMADTTVAVGRTGVGFNSRLNQKVGQAVANKMIAGYTKKLDANLEIYNDGRRDELAQHKNSQEFQISTITDVKVLKKGGMMDPAAASLNSNGIIEFKTEGKKWRMAIRYVPFEEIEAIAKELEESGTLVGQ